MRRYRSNTGFRLTEPVPKPQSMLKVPSIAGRTALGIVVNPKLKVPVLVITDGEYVGIRSLMEEDLFARIGTGYPSDQREEASKFTGYPRVHTPAGVKPRNQGYGTSLYSALCLGAHQTYENLVDIGMKVHGDGVCSDTRDRSEEADAWWQAALRRGLTQELTDEVEVKEENVDISGAVDPDSLTRVASLDDADKRIVYVNDVNVDLETISEITYDVYKHSSMVQRSLLVASFVVEAGNAPIDQQLRGVWNAILNDPDLIEDAYAEPLLALDVRGLDAEAINLISLMYIKAGLDDPAVDAMRERWERNLDPGEVTGQQSLFRANAAGVADVMHAREVVDWEELEDLP